MPLTQWNPATKISRGNVKVGIALAMANMQTPALTELTTNIGLDCAIQTFNGTSSTDNETVDWLCDPASEQLPGTITHSIDDLVIKSSGGQDAALYTGLAIGSTVYIWRRDGAGVGTAIASGDYIWVWKAVVTSVDPLEANNTFIGITAHISVLARVQKPVAVV